MVAIKKVPLFSELYDRGRGDITQFSRDFISLPPPIESLHDGQVKWLHNNLWTPERMLSSGNRFGKCLRFDTMVQLVDGSRKMVRDIEIGDEILALDDTYRVIPVTVRDKVCNGRKDIVNVVTSSGRKIKVTREHPFLTPSKGWVEAQYISVGDYIATPRRYSFTTGNSISHWAEAVILGLLISDGGLTCSISFTNTNPALAERLGEAIGEKFGDTAIVKRYEDRKHKRSPQYGVIGTEHGSNPVKGWLTDLGLMWANSYHKFVPDCIFTWNQKDIATFLSHLYAGDGWASRSKGGVCEIGYGTNSEKLAHDIQHLLLRFGVKSDIRIKYPKCNGKTFVHYTVGITNKDDIAIFAKDIGILGKEDSVQELVGIGNERGLSRGKDIVPGQQEKIRKYQGSVSYTEDRWELCRSARGKTIRRDKLEEIGLAFNDQEMTNLATSDIYWDKVVSIEDVGKGEVWDLCVEPYHNFIANDIFVHNTTAAAVKLLHHGFYQTRMPMYSDQAHEYICISLSITLDMAQIAWDMAVMLASNSKLLNRFVLEIKKRDPFPVMILGDGNKWRSEIWARSTARAGTYLLGRAFDFVNWDEAARDPNGRMILDDVLRMRMADRQGRIDMTSTGAGKNWYWKQCDMGRRDAPEYLNYYFQTGSTYENPSISEDRIEDAKGRMSDRMVKQNIYGEFVDFAAVFPIEDIEKCYRGYDYKLLHDPREAVLAMKDYPPEASFAMGVDLGRRKDETVILVARTDVNPSRLVYAQSLNISSHWEKIYDTIAKVHHTFKDALAVVDASSLGGDISVDLLRSEQYGVRNIVPYVFSGGSGNKEHLITVGQMALQQKSIVWPYIPELYDQLGMYDYNDKKLNTDWVMAFCMLAEGIRRSTEHIIRITPAEFMLHTFRWEDGSGMKHNTYAGEEIELKAEGMPAFLSSKGVVQ